MQKTSEIPGLAAGFVQPLASCASLYILVYPQSSANSLGSTAPQLISIQQSLIGRLDDLVHDRTDIQHAEASSLVIGYLVNEATDIFDTYSSVREDSYGLAESI
jgi:hypothetical protein